MSLDELEIKIAKMQEWEELAEEAKKEADALRESIKAEMIERKTEELQAGRFIVHWTVVISNRFDTTAFKKVMPDVYKAYTKPVTSRRFTIG